MSKTEENLLGKDVSLYLEGGWEVSGVVRTISDNKIVLEQQHTGELFLVFREKVSCLRFSEGRQHSSFENKDAPQEPVRKSFSENEYIKFPVNDIGYSESGMSIPQGMLNNLSEEDPDDLSVSFGNSQDSGATRSNIEFRIDDDSKKEG